MGRAVSLLDRVRADAEALRPKKGPVCSVCRLDPEWREAVLALREDGYTIPTIARVLQKNGQHQATGKEIGRQTIAEHLRAHVS